MVVNNLDGPPSLLRNDGGNRNAWILVKCVGTRSNRSAIGTRVKVTAGGRTQMDEVMSGSSYYSQSDFRLHFGLGAATQGGRDRDRVAVRREGDPPRPGRQSPLRLPRGRGHRRPAPFGSGGSQP